MMSIIQWVRDRVTGIQALFTLAVSAFLYTTMHKTAGIFLLYDRSHNVVAAYGIAITIDIMAALLTFSTMDTQKERRRHERVLIWFFILVQVAYSCYLNWVYDEINGPNTIDIWNWIAIDLPYVGQWTVSQFTTLMVACVPAWIVVYAFLAHIMIKPARPKTLEEVEGEVKALEKIHEYRKRRRQVNKAEALSSVETVFDVAGSVKSRAADLLPWGKGKKQVEQRVEEPKPASQLEPEPKLEESETHHEGEEQQQQQPLSPPITNPTGEIGDTTTTREEEREEVEVDTEELDTLKLQAAVISSSSNGAATLQAEEEEDGVEVLTVKVGLPAMSKPYMHTNEFEYWTIDHVTKKWASKRASAAAVKKLRREEKIAPIYLLKQRVGSNWIYLLRTDEEAKSAIYRALGIPIRGDKEKEKDKEKQRELFIV